MADQTPAEKVLEAIRILNAHDCDVLLQKSPVGFGANRIVLSTATTRVSHNYHSYPGGIGDDASMLMEIRFLSARLGLAEMLPKS